MNITKGVIVTAASVLSMHVLSGSAFAQGQSVSSMCADTLSRYGQATQQFDGSVRDPGSSVIQAGGAQVSALFDVLDCTDSYLNAVMQDRAVCPEARAYMNSAISLPVSQESSGIRIMQNSGRINGVCATRAPSAPPVAVQSAPVVPSVSAIPQDSSIEDVLDLAASLSDTESENITESENATEIAPPGLTSVSGADVDEIQDNEISTARLSRTATSEGQPWLNFGPFYTTSNPSQLSTTPSFEVLEGMDTLVQTNGRDLNVRSGPSLSNPVIGSLDNGTSVQLSGSQETGWVETNSDGWVHSDYLSPQ